MNKLLVLIVAMIVSFQVSAHIEPTIYTPNEQLYVVAYAGLNLRVAPTSDSEVLIKIPYGELVDILNNDQECITIQEIEYVRGAWSKVSYDGYEGYVFDGFLSPLAVPGYHAEVTHEGAVSIFNLLDNWIDINMLPIDNVDTISTETNMTVLQRFEGGEQYEKILYDNGFRSRLTLLGVRIMDVYHLVKGFYTTNDLKEEVDANTIFVKDSFGNISRIKIELDHPVNIKILKTGAVQVTITKDFKVEGC